MNKNNDYQLTNIMSNKISHDSEVLAQGQQVITVCGLIHMFIDGREKVFMAKRAATKKFLPGNFELPGGHVDYGEDMIQALKREVMEEFSMKISVGDPFAVFTYINEIKGSHSIQVTYFAEFIGPLENITINHEDHSEFVWVGELELESIYTATKKADDAEIQAIRQGFKFLNGSKLRFK